MFLVALVIVTAYSASLTSFLAVTRLNMPFNSLEELYYQSEYKVASIPGTAFQEILEVWPSYRV